MVAATTHRWFRRIIRWRRSNSPWKACVLLILMLISTVSSVRAGDLKNTGTINNAGQMRVQNQATGLPAVNGGVYEFFGGNQTIPGRQYVDLKLTGTGTKTVDANATVTGTMTVNAGVIFDTGPFTMHLNGMLNETGYVSGTIDKTLLLTGAVGSSSFGNIGTTISWNGVPPGNTTVVRKSGTAVISPATGKQSIRRYYDITPSTNANLDATLVFEYANAELGGQNAATLTLWKSTDGGATWRNQGGVVNTTTRTIIKSGISSFSRWTASDASNPLGPVSVEGVAENLALSTGNGQTGNVGTVLPMQLTVIATDVFGSPVKDVAVTFAIVSTPAGAIGQSISLINAVTDNTGQAGTSLMLGDKTGTYTVTATSPFIAGSLVTFTATGINPAPVSVATSLVRTSGNNQTQVAYTTLPQPYVVTVLDQFGAPMGGVAVKYRIASVPSGSVGEKLADTLVTTNVSGQAQTTLKLGTKVGDYVVTASSGSLAGSPVTFTSKAVAAAAANITLPLGTSLAGQVMQAVSPPVLVIVTDAYGNPIAGVGVRYLLTSSPSGSSGTSPLDVTLLTDSLGQTQLSLVSGSKAGVYSFQVSVGSLPPQTITLTVTGAQTGTVASRLVQTSGSGQSGVVVTQLASPLVVTALDTASNPVSGVSVKFALGSAPGGATGQALSDTMAVTDSIGQARTFLKLGTKVGQYTATAISGTLSGSPITFAATATAGTAARLVAISGDRQSSPVSTALSQPFVVQVTDYQLNPIAGVAVNFGIVGAPANATGQALDASQRTTNSQGLASVTLTLGDKAGNYRVDATSALIAGGVASFTGTATVAISIAKMLLLTSGQDQRGLVRSILPQPFVVRTVDTSGNPVSGVSVQFAIDTIPAGATGQALSQTSVTTDILGYGSTLLTFGDMTGTYTVRATSAGLTGSPLTLRAMATLASGAFRMVYTSGDGQKSAVLSQLPDPLVATVFDADGKPVAGQVVTFAIDSLPSGATGQVLSPTSSTTDAQGRATTSLTFGSKIGTYKVTASVAGLGGSPVTFRLTSTVGLPKTFAMVRGTGQTKPINTILDNPFVVSVSDVAGNPVPGVSVAFAIDSIPTGSTGQSLRVVNSLTDAQGQSQAVLTLGSKVGDYVVSASSAGLAGSPVRFSARATAGPAAVVLLSSGDNQTALVSTELLLPFVVTVTDIGGNIVAGSAVTFAIETTPSGARGQALRIVNAVTDALGQASAYLMLGDKDGRYTVTATVSGLTSVRFSSTAAVLVGDVNGDRSINIADLTTVIDYLLGKLTLIGSDSVKADFNRDGHINTLDVVAMQDFLLSINAVGAKPGVTSDLPSSNSTGSATTTLVDSTGTISGELVLTENGVRFNLTNTVPAKGVQLIIRFRDVQSIMKPDEIFDRAKMDSFYVNSIGRELRIVMYNMKNVPIAAGEGTLFRLPLKLSDVSGIQFAQMIVSRSNNTAYFDEAYTRSILARVVKPDDLPLTFVLYQNYPNPFNGQTNISYEVMDVSGMVDVTIQLYDVLGEKVKTLETARHAGGRFTVRWDGTDDRGAKLSSGTYYYRLISGSFVSSKKMIMLK